MKNRKLAFTAIGVIGGLFVLAAIFDDSHPRSSYRWSDYCQSEPYDTDGPNLGYARQLNQTIDGIRTGRISPGAVESFPGMMNNFTTGDQIRYKTRQSEQNLQTRNQIYQD